ncbi:MAG: FHA domain-containing protein [Nannocystaceae bacterium]|nr:FHA domain-containing protein [Nannocystaceae bacterium]
MPLRLIIEDDEGATTIVPLGEEAITIGRQQGNTIQLTEKNVSRTHARLFPDSEAWMIEDLNSYNGIKVNDKAVDGRMRLAEGDIVQIGDYHLAITEDVDKHTLNYDRAGVAANDGDPMVASSSADLPRMSPAEIHALSSGPQPITPAPPMMLDSGPVPALPYARGHEEPKKKGGGWLIVIGLLLLGGGLVAAVMLQSGDDGSVDGASASAGKAAPAGNATPPKTPPREASDVTPVAPPTPPSDDGGSAAVPTPEPAATPLVDVDPTPPPVDDEPVVIEDNPAPAVVPPTPKPSNNNTKKKKKKPPKPKAPPANPPPPKDTGPTADELLAEARKLSFRDPVAGYKLAKQAYAKKPSQKALATMGSAACRMGDKSKAKSAFNKLRGAAKEDLRGTCASRGITL